MEPSCETLALLPSELTPLSHNTYGEATQSTAICLLIKDLSRSSSPHPTRCVFGSEKDGNDMYGYCKARCELTTTLSLITMMHRDQRQDKWFQKSVTLMVAVVASLLYRLTLSYLTGTGLIRKCFLWDFGGKA